MLIKRDGIVAKTILAAVCFVRSARQEGEARACREGIAKKEPMRVCGRLNRHTVKGKEGFSTTTTFSWAVFISVADNCDVLGTLSKGLFTLTKGLCPRRIAVAGTLDNERVVATNRERKTRAVKGLEIIDDMESPRMDDSSVVVCVCLG